MKIPIALLFAICIPAYGQAVRNSNGFATNLTIRGLLTNSTTFFVGGINVTNIGSVQSAAYGASSVTLRANGIQVFSAEGQNSGNMRSSGNMFWATNPANSQTTISLDKPFTAFATNANLAFSGLGSVEGVATNMQSTTVFITNSAAAAITVTMSAAFQNMNASEGNTLFVTNLGHMLVFLYPRLGTNFYFKSR